MPATQLPGEVMNSIVLVASQQETLCHLMGRRRGDLAAGALFFKNWSSVGPSERYKSWDKKFQLLKSYPNVLVSPHSAFLTKEALENISGTTVANIKEFQDSGKLTYEVLPK